MKNKSKEKAIGSESDMDMRHEKLMHRAACLVGGYAAIYTVMTRLNFGSSQTVNLLELVKNLLGRNFAEAFLHFIGAVVYGGSVFAASYLKCKKRDVYTISVCISAISFIVMGLLPEHLPAVVCLYPSFAAMSFMWIAFGGLCSNSSAPIFSTNNFRQVVGSVAEYCADGKREHLKKAKFYAGTLLFFHIGAFGGYIGSAAAGTKAAFFGLLPVLLLFAAVKAPKIFALFGNKFGSEKLRHS